ncbi:MAG: VOC family protein [Chloroflexi bacterium]|nr:VOC family protein [Chloroflexota bacterium]
MITGAHTVMFADDAEQARAFLRDVLGFDSVDAGGGWLIFALPPGELGVHPIEPGAQRHELYLMCDDINTTVAELTAKGVHFTQPVENAGFGLLTRFGVPGAGELALYQPRHPTAIQSGR